MRLPQELTSLGYVPYRGELSLGPGLLNQTALVTNPQGDLFCFRRRKYGHRRLVSTYLGLLYKAMGLYELAGRVVFRNIAGQVALIADCQAASLDVPELVASGTNWMLTRYVLGVLLKDRLSTALAKTPVLNFLNGLVHAHDHGIILADRWGGNEIVTQGDRITFLDFDVEFRFRGLNTIQYAASFDLAIALRACLLWPQDKKVALNCVLDWIRSLPSQTFQGHDLPLLARALRGSCEFYDSPARPTGLGPSAPLPLHRATNTVVYQLADYIEQTN